jgi:sRNA-binding protein
MSKESRKRYQQKRQLRLQAEILRGMKEAREAIVTLQSLWPAAFPDKFHRVRPLASGIVPAIAERTGWSRGYARGVVHVWKARNAYCKAVLCYDRRFDLNGELVDQPVEDSAREQARRQLAARKARVEARNRKAAAENVDIPAAFAKTGEISGAAHIASAS